MALIHWEYFFVFLSFSHVFFWLSFFFCLALLFAFCCALCLAAVVVLLRSSSCCCCRWHTHAYITLHFMYTHTIAATYPKLLSIPDCQGSVAGLTSRLPSFLSSLHEVLSWKATDCRYNWSDLIAKFWQSWREILIKLCCVFHVFYLLWGPWLRWWFVRRLESCKKGKEGI